jgi:hypothetical protein
LTSGGLGTNVIATRLFPNRAPTTMIIAEAIRLSGEMGLARCQRFLECLDGRLHDLVTISLQHVRVEYCRHCGSLFADDVLINSPLPPSGRQHDSVNGSVRRL